MKQQPRHETDEAGAPVTIVPPQVLADRMGGINSLIAKRAFELYEKRGKVHGKHLEDWLQAEDEVVHSCRHDLRETEEVIILRAEIPSSYKADQLQISIEAGRLMVSGEREVEVSYWNGQETRTEPQPQRIFRLHELPIEIDPSSATAVLKKDVLTVIIPKVSQLKAKTQTARSAG